MRSFLRHLALRPGEGPLVAVSAAYFAAVLAATYVVRPVRDALGIEAGIHTYAWLFTGTFVVTLALNPVFGAIARRTGRTGFAVGVHLVAIAVLLGFRALLLAADETALVARAFFVWASVFNVLVVSTFWSVMADLYSPAAGVRLFGPIAAGGTVGALLGPLITRQSAELVGVPGLLLVSAGLLGLATGAVLLVRRLTGATGAGSSAGDPPIGGAVLDGARRIAASPQLQRISGYVLLLTATATFAYFQQARIVEDALADRERRAALFASIDLATNGGALLLQLVVARHLLGRLGVPLVLALLPLATGLGFAILAIAPTLAALVVLQVGRRAINYGLAKPTRELLFTTATRRERFAAKNFIDLVVYRGGDAAIAWLNNALMALSVAATALIALPLTGAWAMLALVIGRHHQRQAASAAALSQPEEPRESTAHHP